MALINVNDLTFSYEGDADNVFEGLSFQIDSDWRLGLIGRNGKGKTTLLRLFMGEYEYGGKITASTKFDYFPYDVSESDLLKTADELIGIWKPQVEPWQVMVQLNQIKMDAECLYRPFGTLSFGERTRVMLAVLFAGDNEFLLVDEPTNHLDMQAREIIKDYLLTKHGFILVSHDRDLLDAVCDHVLVMNRATVDVQAGNFSSWWENKERSDANAISENEKHLKEIGKLKNAMDRTGRWAQKSENAKIGFDPVKENDRSISTRSYIGAKTKKAQARVKSFEKRVEREISEKEGLLRDIERVSDLKLTPLTFHKEVLVRANDLSLKYETAAQELFQGLKFEIRRGERVVLAGKNGCGKSSIIRAILDRTGYDFDKIKQSELHTDGNLDVASGLVISYISQDTSHLSGSLRDYCEKKKLDESLFLAVLRKLDFDREQFARNIEDFSEGQKKKVLIAESLITPAHLYIWDEPLNYIDVFSRMQIEKLILTFAPTMLLVEHDVYFRKKIATKVINV